jgi:hypothetical protein
MIFVRSFVLSLARDRARVERLDHLHHSFASGGGDNNLTALADGVGARTSSIAPLTHPANRGASLLKHLSCIWERRRPQLERLPFLTFTRFFKFAIILLWIHHHSSRRRRHSAFDWASAHLCVLETDGEPRESRGAAARLVGDKASCSQFMMIERRLATAT